MRFGLCGGPDRAQVAASAGFDYLEINVQQHLVPEKGAADFEPLKVALKNLPVPVEAANCLFPGKLRLCGPERDWPRIIGYLETAFARAEQVGLEVIVFGSGGARNIPEGFDRSAAWQQLVELGRHMGIIAERHRITIAVEPLNRGESNVLNTVAESASYVREVNHPAVRLLVDSYHWAKDDGSQSSIVEAGDLLCHVHVGTKENRLAPGLEPFDFRTFFSLLKQANYNGRVSIEAKFNDIHAEAAPARRVLLEAATQGTSR